GELRRTGHIGPLPDHDEDAWLLGEGLRSRETEWLRLRGFGCAPLVRLAHALLSISVSRGKTFSVGCVPHFRGGWASSAFAIAAMCSGVFPQQPPAMLINPPRAKSPR